MTQVLIIVLGLLIGFISGLRALTPPAVVAWGAALGWINLDGTWAHWVGHPITVTVLTILLVAEFVTDQLPSTPARTSAAQFAARLVSGAFAGAVIGTAFQTAYPSVTISALGAGVVGAVLGTMGGYRARIKLTAINDGHDLPVALCEDAIAVLGGFAIVALATVV